VYSYAAYGLNVRSALALPELSVGDGAPDVVVRLGEIDHASFDVDAEGDDCRAVPAVACRHLAGVGTFLVRHGREIVVDPTPGVDPRVLRLAIVGPALALVLHQRGRLILHASAVECAGMAVAFAGGSGWGKSTLAAALHARGYAIVADDLTAIDVESAPPTVAPAFPQLKLWPEAVESLGEIPETMPQLHPAFDKRARRVVQGFADRALPLQRIYLLTEGADLRAEPLQPSEALIGLMPHWYGFRFGRSLLEVDGAAAAHLRRYATLAGRVAVHRLVRPRQLRDLQELASFVESSLTSVRADDLHAAPAAAFATTLEER